MNHFIVFFSRSDNRTKKTDKKQKHYEEPDSYGNNIVYSDYPSGPYNYSNARYEDMAPR